MDSVEHSYSLQTHKLPSARSVGDPITSLLNPRNGSQIRQSHPLATANYIVSLRQGKGFSVPMKDI